MLQNHHEFRKIISNENGSRSKEIFIEILERSRGTWGTLKAFSGIFFLYNYYEGLSGKWGLSAPCAPKRETRVSIINGDTDSGHSGQSDGHFRDLFLVQFLRRTFRKIGSKCPECPDFIPAEGEHVAITPGTPSGYES